VRKLIIVASPIVRLPPEPGARRTSLGYTVVRSLANLAPPFRERILDWGRERFGSTDYKAAGALRPTLVRVVNEDWRPVLSSIKVPVLLIWGSEDAEVPLQVAHEALEELPTARLVTLEGAGHFPFLDQPEPFTEAVTNFLAEPHD
jgi:pimeloyl-ACP methyl ester carboxylesterase